MSVDTGLKASGDAALAPLAPGPLIDIGNGTLTVTIAPEAGGRIAQVRREGVEWLAGYDDANAAAIAWGCYPMLPWAGRIRRGLFQFAGNHHRLPPNLGGHAIHGVGFALPWRLDAHSPSAVELSLELPSDERWPFGGRARQRIVAAVDALHMGLEVSAGERAMPVAIGWHPWFRKPERIEFKPTHCYPRDAENIATLPLREPPPPPWDDCFLHREPIFLHHGVQRLRLTSDCSHWVVYDAPAHATCIEPQTGPPDSFNLDPTSRLEPGMSIHAWFALEWL